MSKNLINNVEIEEEEEETDFNHCDFCGSDLRSGYPEDGCPYCKPCGGMFSPGTEECDWCRWYDFCVTKEISSIHNKAE